MDLLYLIVMPQLSGGWQHIYSAKRRQAGRTNEQSIYSLMSMLEANQQSSQIWFPSWASHIKLLRS
jgi:hypothetical protein